MKHGRTSIVDFVSQLVVSVAGFAATIALTQTLGQEKYGTYVVVLAVLSWLMIAGTLGLPPAIRKRLSESDEGNYVVPGAVMQFTLFALVAAGLWVASPYVNEFIGIPATWIIIGLLAVRMARAFVQTVLEGQHLVHIASVLSPVERTVRSAVQIVLVVSGFGLVGAFAGYAVGAIVAGIIGLYLLDLPRTLPSRTEFSRLRTYAQLSWLGTVKSRTFISMDTLVLAVFVSNSLIAVYEVSWSLATLFAVFSGSIQKTLFPEISRLSSEGEHDDEITELLRTSLAYSGLFLIPGIVGAVLVGDTVLTVYGSGFDTGYYILLILTFARLLYGYMSQFQSVTDAVDRPEFSLYVNTVFVLSNLALNLLLTWQFGWYGAAVATTTSAALGLALAYQFATRTVSVELPFGEIGRQLTAAGVMALVVIAGRFLAGSSLPVVVALVVVGASVYPITLLAISQQFRVTVRDNLPFPVPLL